MENPNWLRLIVVGLVLAAMAFGYFLLSNRFVSTKNTKIQKTTQVVEKTQPTQEPDIVAVQPSVTPSASPISSPRANVTPTNSPAYTKIAERTNKGGIQTLPKTGAPLFFMGIGALSAIATGLGLRKFPN